jgi:hypothetical protein
MKVEELEGPPIEDIVRKAIEAREPAAVTS